MQIKCSRHKRQSKYSELDAEQPEILKQTADQIWGALEKFLAWSFISVTDF